MSHFSQIKTKIRNLDCLKAALTDLGIEWSSDSKPVRGYRGQTQAASIVISQANNYDFGFVWNGQEYELVADLQFWDQPLPVERFLSKLTQRYACRTILQETEKQGFQVTEEQAQTDGTVRLVLQRWGA